MCCSLDSAILTGNIEFEVNARDLRELIARASQLAQIIVQSPECSKGELPLYAKVEAERDGGIDNDDNSSQSNLVRANECWNLSHVYKLRTVH